MVKPDIIAREEDSGFVYHKRREEDNYSFREFVQRGFMLRKDGSLEVQKRSTVGDTNVDQVLTLNPLMAMELKAFLNKYLP